MTTSADRAVVRLPEALHLGMRTEVEHWAARGLETFMFLFLTRVFAGDRDLYLGRSLIVPSENEAERTPDHTRPSRVFCRSVYASLAGSDAFVRNVRLAAVHSHPFSAGHVAFSGTDRRSFETDRRILGREFPGVEFVGIVVDRAVECFEALRVTPQGPTGVSTIVVTGTRLSRRLVNCGSRDR